MRIDDVLGVWPLHGLCGVWGGVACGVFGKKFLGGMGGVSFLAQLLELYRVSHWRLPPGLASISQLTACGECGLIKRKKRWVRIWRSITFGAYRKRA